MANTIRRKIFKTKYKPYIPYDFNDKIWSFFSDKYKFNAPKYFRKYRNKKLRLKNKKELSNIIDVDIYNFFPFKKDANWMWW